MSYPYEDGANDNLHQAQVPENVAGACPPRNIEYRIYPQKDFNALFGNPPASVIT